MLTRRTFVQTAGAITASFITARGREHSIWSAFEPTLHALEPNIICLASNENPLGPGKVVLDGVRAAFGPTGARPGRYSGSASNSANST